MNIKSFLNNKKIFVPFLLFLIIIGICLPSVSFAAWWEYLIPGWNTWAAVRDLVGTDIGKGVFNAIIYVIAVIPMTISGAMYSLAVMLLGWVSGSNFMPVSYTGFDNPVIANGWTQVKDLANMFIVLGFVVIGISTTLRINEYGAKKLLPKLIVVALLINFSLLFCGIFIDASNITMKFFSQSNGQNVTSGIKNVVDQQTNLMSGLLKTDVMQYLAQTLSLVLLYFFGSFIYFMFAGLFLLRYVALWILVMLSPLAFVCYVFPFTQNIWKMWWNNFFQWCIIGVAGSFFVYLSDKVTEALIGSNIATTSKITFPGEGIGVIFVYLVPLCLLLVGFLVSLQASAMGANMVTGFFGRNKGKFMKGALGAATGGIASRGGAWMKDKATAVGEKLNILDKGTTAANKQARLADSRKRLENLSNEELSKISTQGAGTHKRSLDKAAAAEILMKRNAWDSVPAAQREAVAKHAAALGVSKDTISKTDASLLSGVSDSQARQQMMNDERVRLEGIYGVGDSRIEQGVREYGKDINPVALENKKREMSKEKAKQTKLGYTPVSDAEVMAEANATYGTPSLAEITNTRQELNTRRMKEKTLGFSYASKDDARNNLIAEEAKRLRAAGTTGSALDSALDKYAGGITSPQVDAELTRFNQERLQKAVEKMAPSKASELPEDIMTADVVKEFNENQATNIFRNAPDSTIKAFKKSISEHVLSLYRAGRATEARAYINMIREASRRATR